MKEYYESKIGGTMKEVIFIPIIILLLVIFIYISNTLDEVINSSLINLNKYDNLITEYEKYIDTTEAMLRSYAQQVVLYDEKSKADDEIIEYQEKEIKSLESKLENLTEKYVDLINYKLQGGIK